MKELKVGMKVIITNLEENDEICHEGMIGELEEISDRSYPNSEWIYCVNFGENRQGWFSRNEIEEYVV